MDRGDDYLIGGTRICEQCGTMHAAMTSCPTRNQGVADLAPDPRLSLELAQAAGELDLTQFDGHTPWPWRAHYQSVSRGSAKGKRKLSSIAEPIPNQRLGSRSIVLSPAWTEYDGGVWEAWLACSEPDGQLMIEAPRLLAELKRTRAERDALRTALTALVDGVVKGFPGFPSQALSAAKELLK